MSLPSDIANIRNRPGMYLRANTFDVVVSFIDGYDIAISGGLLIGLREWLIVRVDGSNNLAWSGLILAAQGDPAAAGDQAALISGLFSLLEEFMKVREEPDGLRRIYAAYEKWLKRQEWYTPASPDWIAP
jgi:hypothetical protein